MSEHLQLGWRSWNRHVTQGWTPTRFKRLESAARKSSMRTAEILTDAGRAYIKALGNPEGPERLASELIGLRVARWLGLSVPDVAVMSLDPDDEIPFDDAIPPMAKAAPGPAVVTRAIPDAVPLGGTEDEIRSVTNVGDVARVVVVDTWLRNGDRQPPYLDGGALAPSAFRDANRDNALVGLVPSGERRLFAIDFGHALSFKGGFRKARVQDHVRDPAIYGLLPEFRRFVANGDHLDTAVARLAGATREEIEPLLADVPKAWGVDADERESLCDFLVDRADWLVAGQLAERIRGLCRLLGGLEV